MAGPVPLGAALMLAALLGTLGWRVHSGNPAALAVSLGWSALVAGSYWWAESRGRLVTFRRVFFAFLAAAFLLQMHLPRRGPNLEPGCHLAFAGGFLNHLHQQYLAVAGGTWGAYGPLGLGVLWLLVVFAVGGAFCSWVCFLGGADDFCSSLRKPLFRIPDSSRIRVFQLALLLVIAMLSFAHSESEFCRIVCPFKLTGDIAGSHEHPGLAMALSFVVAGLGFVVVLPILTGQRAFCSGVCPFGAIPPLAAKLSPYRVAADPGKCTGCGRCASACPSFAIESRGEGFAVNRYCTSCLRCVEACPSGALRPPLHGSRAARLFPLVAVALGGALSVFYVPAGVLAVARLPGGAP